MAQILQTDIKICFCKKTNQMESRWLHLFYIRKFFDIKEKVKKFFFDTDKVVDADWYDDIYFIRL